MLGADWSGEALREMSSVRTLSREAMRDRLWNPARLGPRPPLRSERRSESKLANLAIAGAGLREMSSCVLEGRSWSMLQLFGREADEVVLGEEAAE